MKSSIFVLVAAIAASATLAQAAEVYDQTVAYETTGSNAGNLYFGTGNQADNFATNTVTDNGSDVTVGLRAAIAGSVGYYDIPGPGGTYAVPPGLRPSHPSAAVAKWDYVYSIDVGSNDISNYTATLTFTDDNTGDTGTYSPLTDVHDNDTNSPIVIPSGFAIQQNGESPSFNLGGYTNFDPNAVNNYTITLTLKDTVTGVTVSDIIHADVVPLPASAWSGFVLLGGLGLFGAVKRNRKQMA